MFYKTKSSLSGSHTHGGYLKTGIRPALFIKQYPKKYTAERDDEGSDSPWVERCQNWKAEVKIIFIPHPHGRPAAAGGFEMSLNVDSTTPHIKHAR